MGEPAKIINFPDRRVKDNFLQELTEETPAREIVSDDFEGEPLKDKATPTGLYTIDGIESANKTIISVIEKINQATDNLNRAINDYDDDLEREIQIDLLRYNLFNLNALKGIDRNFGDIITAIHVCMENKNSSPFSKIELVKLKSVFEIIKNNFNMSEKIFDKCISILDEFFDLFIPMDIDFDES